MLSVVIPSWKDPFLIKTIESILTNSGLGSDLEIIVVLDGYWPTFELKEDQRVRYIHLGKNRGMRGAINAGVAVARGEYIMRTDEHCIFCKDFDKIILETIQPNWIVTMRRYFLDPVKWEIIQDKGYVDYEKLVIQGNKKFSGQPWHERDKKRANRNIDGTMAMQGSCWIMPHKWWDDVIGELQTEGYGHLIQDSTEMIFKTWKAGGRLILNKKAWFAHKHRDFPRTHNNGTKENPANCDAGYKYALDVWRDYYEKEIKPSWGV